MGDTSSGGQPPLSTIDFPQLPPSKKAPSTILTVTSTHPSITLPTSHATSNQILPPPVASNTSSLWSDLFTRASTIPKNYPSPKLSNEGIPIVKAPPSVLLKSSETWKDFIICYFFGDPPSYKKIYSDLNPIWGKKGGIQIRPYSKRACLILIPDVAMRNWVLDIGFWSAGTVAFSTTLWTPTTSLTDRSLTSAPVWILLQNVPPQLWSTEGFELISSGVGDPIPSSKPQSTAVGASSPRVRVVVPLNQGPLPATVIVEDEEGSQIPVEIQYLRLPPLCPNCQQYGHRIHRCLLRTRAPPSSSAPKSPSTVKKVGQESSSATATKDKSVQSNPLNMLLRDETLGLQEAGPNSSISQSDGSLTEAHSTKIAEVQAQNIEPNSEQALPASSPPTILTQPVVTATTTIVDVPPPATDATTTTTGSVPKSLPPQSAPTQQESSPVSATSSAASSSPSSTSKNSDDNSPISELNTSANPYETPSAPDHSALPRHIRFPSTPPPSSSFTSLLLNQLGDSRSPNPSRPAPPFQIPYRTLSLDLSTSPNSLSLLDKTDEKNFEDADDSLSDETEDDEPYPTGISHGYNDQNISDDDFSPSKRFVKGQNQKNNKGTNKGKNKRKGKKN